MKNLIFPALFVAGAIAAHATSFVSPLPAPVVTLQYNSSYTLHGTLVVKGEGNKRQVFLENLVEKCFERHAIMYPAVMPPPGSPRLPRPPYRDVPVTSLQVLSENGTDLAALAQLLGDRAQVEVRGRWGYLLGDWKRGLLVSALSLRGHILGDEVPTVQRLIAVAKKATKDLVSIPFVRVVVGPNAKYLGGLLVSVDVTTRDIAGRTAHRSFVYDGAAHTLTPVLHAVPAAR